MPLPAASTSSRKAVTPEVEIEDRNVKKKVRPNGTQLITVKGLTDRPKPRSVTAPLIQTSLSHPAQSPPVRKTLAPIVRAETEGAMSTKPRARVGIDRGFSEYLGEQIASQSNFGLNFSQQTTVGNNQLTSATSFSSPKSTALSRDISTWKERLDEEQERYHSVSTWAEVMLRRVITETRKLPHPNPLRTSVAMMILSRIVPLCIPYEKLLNDLLSEVLSSMYVDWEDYAKDRIAQVGGLNGSQAGDLVTEYDENCPVEVQDRATVVSSLKRRQTYFQAYFSLQEQRMKVLGKPARVLEQAVNVWRRKILRIFFNVWKEEQRRIRLLRHRVLHRADRRRVESDRLCLESHFRAFRTYVFERRHQCRVVYEEKSRVQLVHRMGRRIKVLEADNARITEQYDLLMQQHWEVAKKLSEMDRLWADWKKKITKLEDGGTDEALSSEGDEGRQNNSFQEGRTKQALSINSDQSGDLDAITSSHDEEQSERDFNEQAILNEGEYVPLEKRKKLKNPEQHIVEASDTAKALPENRMGQLKDFLGMSDPIDAAEEERKMQEAAAERKRHEAEERARLATLEKEKESARPQNPEEAVERAKRRLEAHDIEKSADNVTPTGFDAISDRGPGRIPVLPEKPPTPAISYKDVLEWVSLRVQLIVTDEVVMRRCTNFTTDFKDSVRLAYLLVSLGADRSLFDDIFTAASMMARADVVCKTAVEFVKGHEMAKSLLQPLDIVKGKGVKISKFLFAMHELYHHVPLVVPKSGTLNPRLQQTTKIETTGDLEDQSTGKKQFVALDEEYFLNPPKQTNDDAEAEGIDAAKAAEILRNDKGVTRVGGKMQIKDSQFLQWYRELADSDSDVDIEEDDLSGPISKNQSTIEAATERLQKRMSVSLQRSKSVSAPWMDASGPISPLRQNSVSFGIAQQESLRSGKFPTRRSTKVAVEKKESLAKDNKQIANWVANKLALVNDGEVPDIDRLSNTQLLEALIFACSPSSLQSSAKQGFQRMKVIQDNLSKRFNFKKMKIRQAPKSVHALPVDETISFKQLLTAMYVLDSETTVSL